MHFLFFILFLLLFFFVFIVASVFGILRSLFGGRRKNAVRETVVRQEQTPTNKREKFFKADEGEYVDYEEVEENAQ